MGLWTEVVESTEEVEGGTRIMGDLPQPTMQLGAQVVNSQNGALEKSIILEELMIIGGGIGSMMKMMVGGI